MIGFIILGLVQGAIYGLLAVGIVLVYKGSRVFNFAQAEFGTIAAFMLYFSISVLKVPYIIGVLLALAAAAGVGFIVERLVVRPLFNAPKVTLLVASAGIALLALALELLIGGAVQRTIDPLIRGSAFGVLGAQITPQQILSVLVLGGIAAGLAYFFNKTDLGLAVLALSQEPVATELTGIGTKRMSSFVWVFASVLGGVAGVLQVGISGVLVPGFMTTDYLLLGFTAAVAGGVTSLAGAFVGGELIGVVSALGGWIDNEFVHHRVPGVPNLMVFIALLTILLVRPSGLLGKEA